jgi:hypothetical protein
MKAEDNVKVFGIGLNKTGTSTLGECFRILGYRVMGCSRELLERAVLYRDPGPAFAVAERYDAFQDWPWPLIYRELDRQFPGSKFILTVRENEDVWLQSLMQHSLRTSPFRHCRKLAYGFSYPFKHQRAHIEFYRRHNRQVRRYFEGCRDFIELCWEHGDGWEGLCTFLETPIPDQPLPHVNPRAADTAKLRRRMINGILAHLCD